MKLPQLHPIDAEAKFNEVFLRLKNEIADSPYKDRKVGSFWDEEWHRAPFEEELTLKQIASLSTDALVKKKSFDTDKMIALAIAVERALDRAAIEPNTTETTPVQLKLVSSRSEQQVQKSVWIEPSEDLTADQALAWYGLQSAAAAIFFNTPLYAVFKNLFLHFPNTIEPNEWMLGTITLQEIDRKKIEEMVAVESPEILIHWRTALSGSGASIHTLTFPYGMKAKDEHVGERLLLPILSALGATSVTLGKRKIPGHYTLHPETAPAIFKALKGNKIKEKDLFSQTFSLPFPFFNLEQVFNSLYE